MTSSVVFAMGLALALVGQSDDTLPSESSIQSTSEDADDTGPRWTRARLRLAAGSEWDTNARRAIQGADVEDSTVAFRDANRPFEVVSDGLARVVIESEAGLRLNEDNALRGHYVLGTKRFFSETTEDLLVQELGVTSEHRATQLLSLGVNGTYKGSRIRSGLRDYDVLTGGVSTTLLFGQSWQADLQARITRFMFDAEPRFNFWGPRAS
ncbi:MAG: hypothetical protein AAFV29_08600, partial [Myxococcota bacterium]